MINAKEIREMRKFGYVCKVIYKTNKDVPFFKYFNNEKEMKAFTKKANELGSYIVSVELI